MMEVKGVTYITITVCLCFRVIFYLLSLEVSLFRKIFEIYPFEALHKRIIIYFSSHACVGLQYSNAALNPVRLNWQLPGEPTSSRAMQVNRVP